ncbi:MAG: nitrilase-related carbon-nitrogen hydrolase [Acidimicrobiales bacterium]|jgi:(R)-amidase
MATRSVSVLLAQLESRSDDLSGNLAAALELLDIHPEVSLAVFPEVFLSGSLTGNGAVTVRGPDSPLSALRTAARRLGTAVVAGVAEQIAGGVANTAVCVDELGAVTACYQKVHLFGNEKRFFLAGDHYLVTTLAGVKVGPIVCYDVEFPEPARAVASAGAELLVTISANMDPYADDHALCLRVRAMENRLPHVYVNRVGRESSFVFCGMSGVADASGKLVASLAPYTPDVRVVEVAIGDRPQPDYLADLRTGIPVANETGQTLEAAS